MRKKHRILLVCYGAAHVGMCLPLYRAFAEKDEPIFLALTAAQGALDQEGIPYLGFKDFVDDNQYFIKKGQELIKTLSFAELVDKEETVSYLGMSYADLEDRLGAKKAQDLFNKNGRYCFYQLSVAEKVLGRIKPDMVIGTSSPRMEKAMIVKAHEWGIPNLCLINLFNINHARDRFRFSGYGRKICVESDYTQNCLIEMGRPADEIEVTGSPAFDSLFDPEPQGDEEEFKRKKGISKGINILWARIGGHDHRALNEKIEEELLKISDRNKNWNIIFRPHPNDNVSYSNLPDNVFVSLRSDNIKLLLQASSIVIVINSTLGTEAAIMGKRVLQFLDDPVYKTNSLVDRKMAVGVPQLTDLEKVIGEQLENKDPIEIDIPSHSTDRIAGIALSMLGGQ